MLGKGTDSYFKTFFQNASFEALWCILVQRVPCSQISLQLAQIPKSVPRTQPFFGKERPAAAAPDRSGPRATEQSPQARCACFPLFPFRFLLRFSISRNATYCAFIFLVVLEDKRFCCWECKHSKLPKYRCQFIFDEWMSRTVESMRFKLMIYRWLKIWITFLAPILFSSLNKIKSF